MPHNPAASVRGPSHTTRKGKIPVLYATEARQLLDSIDVSTPIGLRDRALIGLMVFSFARIGAAVTMKVGDAYVQNRRLWVRLHEKGGKRHEVPCHHTLEAYPHAYLDGVGISEDVKGPLFRTMRRGTGQLSNTPLRQANAYATVGRRAIAAGIGTKISNHTFQATGITAHLKNGGTLENAAAMANHASTRSTQLYDRRSNVISLDEVERIRVLRAQIHPIGIAVSGHPDLRLRGPDNRTTTTTGITMASATMNRAPPVGRASSCGTRFLHALFSC